jgi:hypothetical protein
VEPAAHRERARRIQASLDKWDDEADVEAVIEGAMHVTTHLLNALLHERGLTGVAADLIHSDMPPPPAPVPADLAAALADLRWIEGLRAFHVRGDLDAAPGTGARCRRACALFARLAGPGSEAPPRGAAGPAPGHRP